QNAAVLDETIEKIAHNEQQLQATNDILAQLYVQKKELELEVEHVEEGYFEARGTVDELEKNIRLQSKHAQQVDGLIQQIKDKINQLRLQLLSLKERLNIEFGVDMESIINQSPSEEYNKIDLATKVAKQKKQIDRFGQINSMAVEAYNEMKERYDFIVAQKDDLQAARDTLMTTMEEIEGTATKQFMSAFNQIKVHFKEVFRSLFHAEDTCDLVLLDEKNPLESKIDITAQPKGKRPQSINQLSGGEKSLTALALVFSLYLLKPAPFCILDEVDAPLDDANVGKFISIIRQFSEKSQFILVTHNKNTMASVDVIYGVTMQSNVSKVVPVDFRSLQDGTVFQS
ncbi:MAG: AAA family ATPase, partial [Chitinophagales bacterium]